MLTNRIFEQLLDSSHTHTLTNLDVEFKWKEKNIQAIGYHVDIYMTSFMSSSSKNEEKIFLIHHKSFHCVYSDKWNLIYD